MKYFLILLLTFFSTQSATANKPSEKTWHFGKHNCIKFGENGISTEYSKNNTWESSAVLSDNNGNLLLYANGENVWNGNGERINNERLKGHWSSGSGCILVKQPGNDNICYLFTADGNENYANNNGFHYYKIDITAENGKGAIVETSKLLPDITEKVASCRHANGKDYWIITYNSDKNIFYSFLLTSCGLESPIETSGIEYNSVPFGGYITISPSGKYLTHCAQDKQVNIIEIWDFNYHTGIMSNPRSISGVNLPYCARFSPDETKLYVSSYNPSNLYQYDVSDIDDIQKIHDSRITIKQTGHIYFYASIQEGPDGRYYFTRFDRKHLAVIENPNLPYPACNFVEKEVPVNGICQFSLPNLVVDPLPFCDDLSVDYPFFAGEEELNLVGNAKIETGSIVLTNTVGYSLGAFWVSHILPVNEGFTCEFSFSFDDPVVGDDMPDIEPGADGIVFTIQTEGGYALGKSGGHIGFDGINDCIAIEIDVYENPELNDPDANHTAIFVSGGETVSAAHDKPSQIITSNIPVIKSDSTKYYCKVRYIHNTLEFYINEDGCFDYPDLILDSIDIATELNLYDGMGAFVGITSATGHTRQIHRIHDFSFCADYSDLQLTSVDENSIVIDNSLIIKPNPVQNELNFIIELDKPGYGTIEIFDISGSKVFAEKVGYLSAGSHEISRSISKLVKGVYLLRLNFGDRIFTGEFVK
ncbi:MAG: lectin-like domain-containing protein [Candidatus Kapaibacterium sp.]